MKKRFLAISLMLIVVFTTAISAVSANSSQSRSTYDKKISFDKKSFEPGLVNLSTLTAEEREVLNTEFVKINNYLLKLNNAKIRYDKLQAQKKSDITQTEEVDAQLQQVGNELASLETERVKLGLIRIKETNKNVQTQSSSAADYAFDFHELYYSTVLSLYIFDAEGKWQNNNWNNDLNCPLLGCDNLSSYNIGGYDGFALFSLHKDIAIFQQHFYVTTSNNTATEMTNTASNEVGARGYGWKWQDEIKYSLFSSNTYNSAIEYGWIAFTFTDGTPSSGTTISFKASYGHTWDTTTINGISFGPYSFGFSWASGSHNWPKEQQYNYSF